MVSSPDVLSDWESNARIDLDKMWNKMRCFSPDKMLIQYSRWAHRRPVKILVAEFSLLVFITAVVFAGGFFKITDSQSGREWLIRGDVVTHRQDAIEQSLADLEEVSFESKYGTLVPRGLTYYSADSKWNLIGT